MWVVWVGLVIAGVYIISQFPQIMFVLVFGLFLVAFVQKLRKYFIPITITLGCYALAFVIMWFRGVL